MKKTLRLILRLGAGLLALVAAALILCLDGVDHRPYLREPYYKETTARLRAGVATNAVVRGEVSAGFGRALLTPALNAAQGDPTQGQFGSMPLAGYGGRRGKPATGVHDDVYVKAVAMRVGQRIGVMVGVDALIVPAEVMDAAMQRLEKESGLLREQVYLSATHTHCSLGGWGEGMVGEAFAGEFQPGARVWFADRIVAAVRDAVADLKPAAIGQGRFNAPDFIRNRLVGELGKVDPEFSYGAINIVPPATSGSSGACRTIPKRFVNSGRGFPTTPPVASIWSGSVGRTARAARVARKRRLGLCKRRSIAAPLVAMTSP